MAAVDTAPWHRGCTHWLTARPVWTFIDGLTLAGGRMRLLDWDGAAVVVHAGADDYRTEPAGDAGNRIACGVIRR